MTRDFIERRLFLSFGEDCFQLFSFTQNKTDASIYISTPDFRKVKWLNISTKDRTPRFSVVDSSGDGKISVHGLGMVKITPNESNLISHGNFLLDLDKQRAGARHLCTVQLSEPKSLPASPALNRKGDCVLKAERFEPFVMIFFAVPRVRKINVSIQASFQVNDCDDNRSPMLGMGEFGMVLHSIIWLAYRTKHMNNWPQNPYICYHDGYFVPILIGTGEREFKVELRPPSYELSETNLTIKL